MRLASLKARKARAFACLEILSTADPDPRTELVFSSPFTLLVAVVLSAQATDKSVNAATPALFAAAATPEAMLALGEDGIGAHIRTIGLWRAKARHVVGLSKALIEKHNGAVPNDRAALEALPGVGRKTANVVLSEAFGVPTLAVDTHVYRVARRLGLSAAETPNGVEQDLLTLVAPQHLKGAHHWFILHGRYVCTARSPKCQECPLSSLCPSYVSDVEA